MSLADHRSGLASAADDQRLADVMAEYQQAVTAGCRPNRGELLARHPDLADRIDACIQAVDFVEAALPPTSPARPQTPTEMPDRLGEFRLVREIGRGGMGVVYEAVQEGLGRRVAVKVLSTATSLIGKALQRFRHESQAAATLQHPHIVPVFAVGRDRGVHYYVMQLIDGDPLTVHSVPPRAAFVASTADSRDATGTDHPDTAGADSAPAARAAGPPPGARTPGQYRTIAGWVRQAADALHHAHECDIVHRDVKPGNLLLDRSGHLWVVDFGLAKLPGSDLTGTADVMGTVRYMSPEQASGRAVALDGRSDVYSLGVTLYELLTRGPAFEADDRRELLRQVLEAEPPLPRKRDRTVPPELETICRTAMAKDPAERYQSAAAFRDDLQRFLDDRPITAKPPTLTQRGQKWVKRNQFPLAASLTTLVLAMAVGLVGLGVAAKLIDDQRREANSALDRERDALNRTGEALAQEQQSRANERRTSYLHTMQLACREWHTGNIETLGQLLTESPPEQRRWEWDYLRRVESEEFASLDRNACEQQWLAGFQFTKTGHLFTPLHDQLLWWSLPELTRVGTVFLREKRPGTILRLSPDGQTVLAMPPPPFNTIERKRVFDIWDKQTGEKITHLNEQAGRTRTAAYTADSRAVLMGGEDGTISVRNARSGDEERAWSAHTKAVVKFAVRNSRVASVGQDDQLRIWVAGNDTPVTAIELRSWYVFGAQTQDWSGLDLSPDGKRVALGYPDGTVKVWEADGGRSVASFVAHPFGVQSVRFSPDGRWVATVGHKDKLVKVWDVRREQTRFTFHGHRSPPEHVDFHPSGRFLATASKQEERPVRVWDLTAEAGVRYVVGGYEEPDGPLSNLSTYRNDVQTSADGKLLATVLHGNMSVWEAETGRRLGPPEPTGATAVVPANVISDVRFAADSRSLVVHRQGHTEWWDVPAVKPVRALPAATATLRTSPFSVSPNVPPRFSRRVPTGLRFRVYVYPQQAVGTTDGTQLVVVRAGTPTAVDLHSTVGGGRIRTLWSSDRPITGIAASPGGLLAVSIRTADSSSRILVIDMRSGEVVHEWSGGGREVIEEVRELGFDPPGKRLAVVTAAGELVVTNVETRAVEYATHFHERDSLRCARFSADGDRIFCGLAGSTDSTKGVVVLDARTGKELLSVPFRFGVDAVSPGPDGRSVAVADVVGQVWMIDTRVQPAEQRVGAWRARELLWHLEQSTQAARAGQPDAARWHFDRALATDPLNPASTVAITDYLTRVSGPTKHAGVEPAAVVAHVTVMSPHFAFRVAAQRVQAGDTAGYRRVCARLFDQLTADTPAFNASLVYRLATLGPEGHGNYAELAATAESVLTKHKSEFVRKYILGALRYRAGEYEAARQLLLDCEHLEPGATSHPMSWLFRAMTEHQLGNRDEARKWLAKADAWNADRLTQLHEESTPLEFQVAIPFPLLRTEAAKLLGVR